VSQALNSSLRQGSEDPGTRRRLGTIFFPRTVTRLWSIRVLVLLSFNLVRCRQSLYFCLTYLQLSLHILCVLSVGFRLCSIFEPALHRRSFDPSMHFVGDPFTFGVGTFSAFKFSVPVGIISWRGLYLLSDIDQKYLEK
jgi:hypothetical protein